MNGRPTGRLQRLVAVLLPCALLAVACGDEEGASTGATESNLDTSGCSGLDQTREAGAVKVSASMPPRTSCWNADGAGISLQYTWLQANDATPQWTKIGFWTSVNGVDTFVNADTHECRPVSSGGLGHDTSGTQHFACTALKNVDIGRNASFKAACYGDGGRRLPWDIQVAVARDDGSWDSLDGANYRFSF